MDSKTGIQSVRYYESSFDIFLNLARQQFWLARADHDRTVEDLKMALEIRKREAIALTKERDALIRKMDQLRDELMKTRAVDKVSE